MGSHCWLVNLSSPAWLLGFLQRPPGICCVIIFRARFAELSSIMSASKKKKKTGRDAGSIGRRCFEVCRAVQLALRCLISSLIPFIAHGVYFPPTVSLFLCDSPCLVSSYQLGPNIGFQCYVAPCYLPGLTNQKPVPAEAQLQTLQSWIKPAGLLASCLWFTMAAVFLYTFFFFVHLRCPFNNDFWCAAGLASCHRQ